MNSSACFDSGGSDGEVQQPTPPSVVVVPSALTLSDVNKWKRRLEEARSIGEEAVQIIADIRCIYNQKIGAAQGRQALLPEELCKDETLVKRLEVCLDNYDTARIVSFIPKLYACERMVEARYAALSQELRAALSTLVAAQCTPVDEVQKIVDSHRARERVILFARSILSEDRTCSSMGNAVSSGYINVETDFPLTPEKVRSVIQRAFHNTVASYQSKMQYIANECAMTPPPGLVQAIPSKCDATSSSKRRKLTATEREIVLRRQEGMCVELGCQAKESGNTGETYFEADHIVPHCVTGNNDLTNMQLLCPNCHTMKTKREMRYLHTSGFFRERATSGREYS